MNLRRHLYPSFLVLTLVLLHIHALAQPPTHFHVMPMPSKGTKAREMQVIEERNDHRQLDDVGSQWPKYYTRLDTIYSWVVNYARRHPDLIEIYDIGNSLCRQKGLCRTPGGDVITGRDILVVRVTNEKSPFAKEGRLWIDGGMHARELPTVSLVRAFIRQLIKGYGQDAQITYLLNHRELYAVICSNPDGRLLVELGTAPPYNGQPWEWRKNANNDAGGPYRWPPADDASYGVDLNRNFAFKWGRLPGSSGRPDAETYRGSAPFSEPETKAYEQFVRTLFPDRRGPADDDAARQDAMGVLITLHSEWHNKGSILVPWSWTKRPSPNHHELTAIARRYASFNGYAVSNSLYPVSGSTRDWSYGELGIPSYTIELPGHQFFMSREDKKNAIGGNLPPLLAMLGLSDRPYLRIKGPETQAVQMRSSVVRGEKVAIRARFDESRAGGQEVAGAEVLLGQAEGLSSALPYPGPDEPVGDGLEMRAADGAFDDPQEEGLCELDTTPLSPGRYYVVVRGKDVEGNWGPATARFLDVQAPG